MEPTGSCIVSHGTHAGGSALFPEQHAAAVGGWVEWEACKLRPASLSQGARLQDALKHLEGGLAGGRTFLVGSGITLADVSAGCRLGIAIGPAPLNTHAVWAMQHRSCSNSRIDGWEPPPRHRHLLICASSDTN